MQPPIDPASQDPLEDLLVQALAAHETGGDAALAAFVDAHPEAGPRLREALADLRGADLLQTRTATSPDRFGEFRVTGRLGAGGMGVVYPAEQSSLGREVALKVVRPELLMFDGARERFRREIETVAKLEHPAIVPILATGDAQGVPYYAMPRLRGKSGEAVLHALRDRDPALLRGSDLRTALAETPTAPRPDDGSRDPFTGSWWQACVRCVHMAALGMQHAHARGVLHRDLKPSNLMLLEDGRTVVLDFGLAQAEGDARLTRTGSAAGSPAYMAPEQLRAEPADVRTDVYGLGASLYALLGLRPPFPLGDPQAMRTKIAHGERQPLRSVASLPPELLLVLATAMDVDRTRRYASAGAFADDLQAVLDGRPIHARALPLPVRLRRFAARHRALAAGAAVTLLFAAATPSLLWWQQRAAAARLGTAVDVSLDAVDALLSRTVMEKVRNQPGMQRVAAAMLQDALMLFDRLDDDGERARRVEELRRRVLLRLGAVHAGLGDEPAATEALQRLLATVPTAPSPSQALDAASAHRSLAFTAVRRGDATAASRHADEAAPFLAIAAQDDALRSRAAAERADLCELTGKLKDDAGDAAGAVTALRDGLVAAQDSGSPRSIAALRIALAAQLHRGGADDEALSLLDAVQRQFPDPAAPETGWPVPRMLLALAEYETATIEFERGKTVEANTRFATALARLDDLVRDYPEDPSVRPPRAHGELPRQRAQRRP